MHKKRQSPASVGVDCLAALDSTPCEIFSDNLTAALPKSLIQFIKFKPTDILPLSEHHKVMLNGPKVGQPWSLSVRHYTLFTF